MAACSGLEANDGRVVAVEVVARKTARAADGRRVKDMVEEKEEVSSTRGTVPRSQVMTVWRALRINWRLVMGQITLTSGVGYARVVTLAAARRTGISLTSPWEDLELEFFFLYSLPIELELDYARACASHLLLIYSCRTCFFAGSDTMVRGMFRLRSRRACSAMSGWTRHC